MSQSKGGPASVPPSAGAAAAPAVAPEPRTSNAPRAPVQTTIELTEAAVPSLPLPTPHIELQRPALGEVIEAPGARRYEIRLEIGGYVLTRAGQGAIVSLDGRRPRRWPAEGALALGELLAENEDLTEGAHTVLVALVDAEGRVLRGRSHGGQSPFFLVDFSIGRAEKPPEAPRIFCLAPNGTYYGKGGQSVRLELFPVGPVASTLRLRVEAHGLDAWAEVRPDQPYLVGGLPFGDVSFTALRGEEAVARCIITVNPEKGP